MPNEYVLGNLAVPVVEPGEVPTLIGTAFAVGADGDQTWFLTARHVAEASHVLGIALLPMTPTAAGLRQAVEQVRVVDAVASATLDMALLRVERAWPDVALHTFGSSRQLDARLLNVEYSQSVLVPPDERVGEVPTLLLVPQTHVGHLVQRLWTPDRRTGTRMEGMLLSWAANRGASGSPVYELPRDQEEGLLIRGMVIENRASELLPAHLEEITGTDGGVLERHTYYVPNAIAIAFAHLKEFVAEEVPPRARGDLE